MSKVEKKTNIPVKIRQNKCQTFIKTSIKCLNFPLINFENSHCNYNKIVQFTIYVHDFNEKF